MSCSSFEINNYVNNRAMKLKIRNFLDAALREIEAPLRSFSSFWSFWLVYLDAHYITRSTEWLVGGCVFLVAVGIEFQLVYKRPGPRKLQGNTEPR